MITSPRNKLTLLDTLNENYYCPFCGCNSYSKGNIKSCDHLLYIYRAIDGNTENALLYVTDGVRSHLAAENIDHFQIWEELVLETPFQDTFVIEETFDKDSSDFDVEQNYDFQESHSLGIAWMNK